MLVPFKNNSYYYSYIVNKGFDLINLIIFYNHNDNINEYAFFHSKYKCSSKYYTVTL